MHSDSRTSSVPHSHGAKFLLGQLWLMAALALLGMLQGGCVAPLVIAGAGAAAGVGAYAYVNGELKATEEAALVKAWEATQGAVKELEFSVTTAQKDALTGKIEAQTAAGKKVRITLNRQSDRVTEFRIRVGTFGDESLSRLILDKIKKRL